MEDDAYAPVPESPPAGGSWFGRVLGRTAVPGAPPDAFREPVLPTGAPFDADDFEEPTGGALFDAVSDYVDLRPEEARTPDIAPAFPVSAGDADESDLGEWLEFTGDEAAASEPFMAQPAAGSTWQPDPEAVGETPAAEPHFDIVGEPDSEFVAEPPAAAAEPPGYPEPGPSLGEPSESQVPEPAGLGRPAETVDDAPGPDAGEAVFDIAAQDEFDLVEDSEFRLDEISEEHYFLQATTQEHVGLAEAVAAAAEEETEQQALAASMPGLETGVVGFEDVVHDEFATEDEEDEAMALAAAARGSELAQRVITGLVLAGAVVGAVWLGATPLSVLVVVVMLVALGEFYAVLIKARHQPLAIFGFAGGVVALLGARVWGPVAVPGALMLTMTLVFFYYAMSPHRREPLLNGALTLTGVAWITGMAAFVMPMLDAPDFRILILGAVALTVFMDIGQYFAGRNWGEHRLAPVVSPNKTVEGLLGGVVVALASGAVLGQFEPFDLVSGLVLGGVVAVVAPLGDLAVSMMKRSLAIKDMGGILPGHGGFLDRIDALLFVIPAIWLAYSWLGLLG